TSQGDVLGEFIYTPGLVQTATINIAGLLAKAVDLSPYNLSPNSLGLGDQPKYDANNSDDVIFGSEAMAQAYVQSYATPCQQEVNCATGLVRTDWTRPYNPGDILHFGADTNPWHSNHHNASRLGEFLLYDEFDARRTILFKADGSVWTCLAYSNSGHTCTDTGGAAPTTRPYF